MPPKRNKPHAAEGQPRSRDTGERSGERAGADSLTRTAARRLFAIDSRSLAAFRIAIGLLLLVDLSIRAADLGAMYTDDGMFSRALIGRHYSIWNWSFHLASGSWWYQAALFVLAAVFALALVIGYETRLATVASWLLLVSLHNRVPHVLSGADNLARMLLFWGMFLPLGRVWSVDAGLTNGRGPASVTSVASAAILLQMALMYLFSAIFKSNPDWLHGTALARILPDGFYGRPIGAWLTEFPALLSFLTVAIFAIEWIGPFLLFSPIRTGAIRLWIVGLLAAMHIGIALLLNVGLFSFVSLCGLLLFLPPVFWERLPGRSRGEADEPDRPLVTERSLREPAAGRVSTAASVVCALAFAYVLFANVNGLPQPFVPWTPVARFEPLTVSVGLGQQWDMFSRAPPKTGWCVARANLIDGAAVDLLRGGAPAVWERPDDPAAAYPNHRWRKLFRELAMGEQPGYEVFRRPVAEYLCRAWDRTRSPDQRVSDFALVFCMADENEQRLYPAPGTIRETLIHLDLSRGGER